MSGRTVLVLPGWYPTAKEPLAGSFIRDHTRAAAAFGHRMVVFVNEGPNSRLRGLFELSEERDGALRIFRFAYRPPVGFLVHLPAILLLARRLAREGTPVDLIHAHVHRMAWPATIVAALLRRPFVVSEHSSEWPRRTMSRGALRRAYIALPRAALVCPVNGRLRQAIEAYGIYARFRIVPNAVDTSVFHPGKNVQRSPRRLANVALHIEVKALDVLLRAFAKVSATRPQLTLELIGDGPLTRSLRHLSEELGLGQRVRFRGRVAPDDIADTLRAADLFALSSLSENMPLAVLEALCCGLPVVATNVGGIPEAVGSDGELVPTGDPAALAAAITAVLESYERFDRTDIARRAATRYSLEAVGAVWDEVYRSV